MQQERKSSSDLRRKEQVEAIRRRARVAGVGNHWAPDAGGVNVKSDADCEFAVEPAVANASKSALIEKPLRSRPPIPVHCDLGHAGAVGELDGIARVAVDNL